MRRTCSRRGWSARDGDPENVQLMHAMGANKAGQLADVVAGGVLLALVTSIGA